MLETWRWFGPSDTVTLKHIRQSGARGVVTSLHDVATGDVWTLEAIEARTTSVREESAAMDERIAAARRVTASQRPSSAGSVRTETSPGFMPLRNLNRSLSVDSTSVVFCPMIALYDCIVRVNS